MADSKTNEKFQLYNPFVFRAGQVMAGVGAGCGIGLGFGRPINIGAFPAVGPSLVSGFGDVSRSIVQYGRPVITILRKLGMKNLEGGIGCGFGIGYGYGIGLTLKPGVDQKVMAAFNNISSKVAETIQSQNQVNGAQENTPQNLVLHIVSHFLKASPHSNVSTSFVSKSDNTVAADITTENKTLANLNSSENSIRKEHFSPENNPNVSDSPANIASETLSSNKTVSVGKNSAEMVSGRESIFGSEKNLKTNESFFSDPRSDFYSISAEKSTEKDKTFGFKNDSKPLDPSNPDLGKPTENVSGREKNFGFGKNFKKISENDMSIEEKKKVGEDLFKKNERDVDYFKTANQILITMLQQQNEINDLKNELLSLKSILGETFVFQSSNSVLGKGQEGAAKCKDCLKCRKKMRK